MSQEQVGRAARSLRLRPGIITTVYFWGTVAIIIAFPLSLVPLLAAINQFANQHNESATAAASMAFEAEVENANHDVASLESWLVKQPDVIAQVRESDGESLGRLLALALTMTDADVIAVTGKDAAALVTLWSDDPPGPTANFDVPTAKKALTGTEAQQLVVESSGRLQWQRAVPVYDVTSRPPIGAVVAGIHLDESFLKDAAAGTNTEIVLVHAGQIAATTLTGRSGTPWVRHVAPENIISSESGSLLSPPIPRATDRAVYDFHFKALKIGGVTTPLLYGIGTPQFEPLGNLGTLGLFLAAELLGGLVTLALAGFLLGRSLLKPVHALDAAAQAMANGDLSVPIPVKRRDELGDLAAHLEVMRKCLAQSLQTTTLERNRFAASVRSMGAAAVMTDQKGRVSSANLAAEALLKQDQDSLLGQPWHRIFVTDEDQDDSSGSFWAVNPAGMNGNAGLIIRGRFPLRNQPRLVLDVLSSPVEVDGASAGYMHILQDASTLEQLNRAKDELLLNLAHELRSPLASLRTSIELLMEDYAVMSRHDFGVMLRTLRRSTVKFQNLVETLVDVGRLQSGHFRVQPVRVDFNRLLQDAISQVEAILQARNQTLDLNFRCPLSCQVLADRPRIIQVIINLLSNASKYGPENEPIGVSVYLDGGRVYLEVTDHGPGIAAEEQAQLFQRFYRTKRAEEEGAGIGLGLALSKGIVEAHGGQIGLRSQPGTGTSFWFSLETVAPVDG